MEERLKELKTKITSFIKDYDIRDFSVYINSQDIRYSDGEEKYKVNSIDISLEV